MSDPINTNPMPVEPGIASTNLPAGRDMAGSDVASSDMAGGRNTVACLFETRAAADRAAADLAAAGTDRSSIEIIDQEYGRTGATVAESGGMWESIKRLFTGEDDTAGYYEGVNRGNVLLTVHAMSAAEAERASAILERHDPIDLEAQEATWRQSGWTGAAPVDVAPMDTPPAGMDSELAMPKPPGRAQGLSEPAVAGRSGEQVIPVVEEKVAIGKRAVAGGRVRVHSYTVETPVEQDVRLRDDQVQVERRPVDRPLEGTTDAFRERTVEMTETREEAVVGKTARVVEEVVVRTQAGERVEHVADTTRRTEVKVEDERTGKPTAPPRR